MKTNNKHNSKARHRHNLHERAFDCAEAGDADGCAKCITELLRGDPREPWVDHIRGFMFSETGDQAKAIPFLRRAAKLLPDESQVKVTLGIALLKNGEGDEAENLMEQALAMEPDSISALTNLGCVLLTRVENPCPERAEALLRRADKLCPGDAYVWANLGHSLALQGRKPEAYPALRRAISLDKNGSTCRRIAKHYPELRDETKAKLDQLAFISGLISTLQCVKANAERVKAWSRR